MKIISKFRDYYDAMAFYGIEPDLVYDRFTETEEIPSLVSRVPKHMEFTEVIPNELKYRYGKVSFCRQFLFVGGEFYSYFLAQKLQRQYYSVVEYEQFIYNETELASFAQEHMGPEFFTHSRLSSRTNNFENLSKLFITIPEPVKKLADETPLWRLYCYYSSFKLQRNPNLKALGLSNFIPASKVHQNISMWLASHKEPPAIPHIDDLTMSQAKGFDRFSFRKSKK